MSHNEFFDVIVIGGGPAGLGSAVHLAEKGVHLLLLEKGKICSTKKTWLTFDHIIQKYTLHECVRNRFSNVIFSCYLGNSYSFESNDFISPIDEERTLELLLQRAKSNGAIIRDEEPFLNYSTVRYNKKPGIVPVTGKPEVTVIFQHISLMLFEIRVR